MKENYQLTLLYFVHLLIGADGVADTTEIEALHRIKRKENIPDRIYTDFSKSISSKTEREVYQIAIDQLLKCNQGEKLNVLGTLYRLSEVDGRVHSKEIKLILYSIEDAGIEFNDVVDYAKANLSII